MDLEFALRQTEIAEQYNLIAILSVVLLLLLIE